MDPHQLQRLHLSMNNNAPHPPAVPSRTANSTPSSSPGLFSLASPGHNGFSIHSTPDGSTPALAAGSPYLHPLQSHKVRETHKALLDHNASTGRKLINQYEVLEELGRGVHGKVKLARNLETNENVAIKIIPRFSKKRRLGKVTASPQDKTKREIAILKKIRHPNVVAVLEIIDDPELKKIYVVLEHVELGEVVWRKKGLPFICHWERRLVENAMHGVMTTTGEEEGERYLQLLERRQAITEMKRAKMQETQRGPHDFWSLEYGAANEEDYFESAAGSFGRGGDHTAQPSTAVPSLSPPGSRAASMYRSSIKSVIPSSPVNTHLPPDCDASSVDIDVEGEMETSAPLRSQPGSSTALDSLMYDVHPEDPTFRGRSPSMADSIISHMSSVDFNAQPQDPFSDDFSYVPCFTIDEARATFRDTVLGLEYLHYEGVVHRDIKPANLLWTKDHRVKISDFGVSYFGRPIRDGEPDELVSESEARDFDDDLELAKTVGTPAFFAPELCYTDVSHEQPKISEQIDVWSLGVTLYCLIFARIPFMAEDEFQMFKKIAKEEVYIPRRRLRPVDPQHSPSSTSFYNRVNSEPYRDDNVLSYEEVDDELHDLLRQMLTKNPEKRIRLKDVKKHPWVVADINMPVAQWIDETDPSRRFSGRKIEVDEKEIKRAVVPLTLMERARSVVKKAVNKVMHSGRTEKPESQNHSRRRATSSVASSGELPSSAVSFSARDLRRKSIRPDEYFSTIKDSEHRFSYSISATPQESPTGGSLDSPQQPSTTPGGDFGVVPHDITSIFDLLPGLGAPISSSTSLSSSRGSAQRRHRRISSINSAQCPSAHAREARPMTVSPVVDTTAPDDQVAFMRKVRDLRLQDDAARSMSADRALFATEDKRAVPMVAISNATAPGSIELPVPKRPLSVDPGYVTGRQSPVPRTGSPTAVRTHSYPKSDPNMYERSIVNLEHDRHPITSNRIMHMDIGAKARLGRCSTPDTFARAQEQSREVEQTGTRRESTVWSRGTPSNPPTSPSSPSLDDENLMESSQPPSRVDTADTLATSTSVSTEVDFTPLTSPSAVTSPISIKNLPQHSFHSDPSLPALLSGASSVSADAEGEFLLKPGSLHRPALLDTSDSLTPPALGKEPVEGFPLRLNEPYHTPLQRAKYKINEPNLLSPNVMDDDEGNSSDSDGCITMAKPRRRAKPKEHASFPVRERTLNPKRRDTQTSITSIGSTETAKKVMTAEP
ncbi:kinase-like protein [Xylaria sp. CBS 124048]|nr:kinase-like protein [Xylaria sp. CBS 124048]